MDEIKNLKYVPDFLIVGAGRSGTTALYNYLDQLDTIFMSPVKEPCFFTSLSDTKSVSTAEYNKLFAPASEEQLSGEASPLYMLDPQTPQAIKKANREMRIIAILRQPVERMFSHYKYHRNVYGKEDLTFREIYESIMEDSNNVKKLEYRYFEKSLYADIIESYLELFGDDQVKVLIFKNFFQEKNNINEVLEFLGVSESIEQIEFKRINQSSSPKFSWLNKIVKGKNILKNFGKYFLPLGFRRKLKRRVFNWNRKKEDSDNLSPEMKKELFEVLFAEDVRKLEKILDIDLSSWRAED